MDKRDYAIQRDYVMTDESDGEVIMVHGVRCTESYSNDDTVARIHALFPLLARKFRRMRNRNMEMTTAEENKILVQTVGQLLREYKRVQQDLEMAISRADRASQDVLL